MNSDIVITTQNETIEWTALLCEAHAIQARVEGMKSENISRQLNQQGQAYDDNQFFYAEDELKKVAVKLRALKTTLPTVAPSASATDQSNNAPKPKE